MTEAQLEAFVRSTSAERLFGVILTEADLQTALAETRRTLRNGVEVAGRSIAAELPGTARGIAFDVLSLAVIDGIRALDSRVLVTLGDGIRETVRAYVENGLRDGVGPRTIARGLRDIVGLAPNQLAAVQNFERMLRTGDTEALTRALRDRRFDRFIRDGTMTPERIDRAVDTYRKRFIAFNAETNARTAALDAQKLAQELTWGAAIDRGDIDGGRLMKRWSSVRDDRVRPEHQLLEGEVVGHNEAFSNGDVVPGESTFNCRCLAIYFTARDPATARQPGRGAATAAA